MCSSDLAVACTTSGPRRAVVSAGKGVWIFDFAADGAPRSAGRRLLELPTRTGTVDTLAWSPDGASFVIGTNTGEVERFDAATGLSLGSFARHGRGVISLDWSPAGRTLVYSGVIDPVRRPEWMLDVFDRVRGRVPDAAFLVITYQQDDRRRAFEAKHEFGCGENAPEGHLDAVVEAAGPATGGVELYECRHLFAADGFAERARGERLHDAAADHLGGAKSLLVDVVEHDRGTGELGPREDVAHEVAGKDGAPRADEDDACHQFRLFRAGTAVRAHMSLDERPSQ